MVALLLLVAFLLGPEPYGGCDEAYAYPDTAGYTWCQLHGWDLP